MKFLAIALLVVLPFILPAQPQPDHLPPRDLKAAFTIDYKEGTDWEKFQNRHEIANCMYVLGALMVVVGVTSDEVKPGFWYVPASFWLIGFVFDRSSYYVIKKDN